jgi:putative phosphotransacetylase
VARPSSLPVLIAARHVRLSQPHLELLFGAGAALFELAPLPPTGGFAALELVEVRGPAGTLPRVRVLGPVAATTEVRLGLRDASALGLEPSGGSGCTLVGPHGSVALAAGVHVGLRRLTLTGALAAQAGLAAGSRAQVHVLGERARELRDVPVELGESAWLDVDIEDANAIEVGPATRASIHAVAPPRGEPSAALG